MNKTVHLYVFDGFADWEAAWATAGINNPEFQREPGAWRVQTVAAAGGLVRSMGGLSLLPDLRLTQILPDSSAMLILPGGPGWDQGQHLEAVRRGQALLEAGVPVAAICGATAGLARLGLLDARRHTSNARAYLAGTDYGGAAHYVDEAAAVDEAGDLITAGGMHPLEFARAIFRRLGIYEDAALDAWYRLYKDGDSASFAKLRDAAAAP